jgi:malonyl-CoA O-methyltransferase
LEIRKERCAKSFSQKCSKYSERATLQKSVYTQLLLSLENEIDAPSGVWLDIGSGPAIISNSSLFKNCNLINYDIAMESLQFAQKSGSKNLAICGDMDLIGIKEGTLDGIISSSALQWSSDPILAILDFFKLLKSGGVLAISIFTENSLKALNDTQKKFNITSPTTFICADKLNTIFQNQNLLHKESSSFLEEFDSPHSALRSITSIGTGNSSDKKLSKREVFSFIEEFAKRSETDNGTYQNRYNVSFLILEKR